MRPALRLSLLLSSLCLAAGALAQSQLWEWVVEEGGTSRRVISDRPPPPGLKNVRITKRPGGAPVSASAPAAGGASERPAVEAKRPEEAIAINRADPELLARKKQADEVANAQKREADQAVALVKQQNCEKAREAQAQLDSGVRISNTGADGNREVLDDAGRAAQQRRITQAIQASCS